MLRRGASSTACCCYVACFPRPPHRLTFNPIPPPPGGLSAVRSPFVRYAFVKSRALQKGRLGYALGEQFPIDQPFEPMIADERREARLPPKNLPL